MEKARFYGRRKRVWEERPVADKAIPSPDERDDDNFLTQQRRKKLEGIRASGANPFVNRFSTTHQIGAIVKEFHEVPVDGFDEAKQADFFRGGENHRQAGAGESRLCRSAGRDGTDSVFIRMNEIGEESFQAAKELDIGDIVGAEGGVFPHEDGRALDLGSPDTSPDEKFEAAA